MSAPQEPMLEALCLDIKSAVVLSREFWYSDLSVHFYTDQTAPACTLDAEECASEIEACGMLAEFSWPGCLYAGGLGPMQRFL